MLNTAMAFGRPDPGNSRERWHPWEPEYRAVTTTNAGLPFPRVSTMTGPPACLPGPARTGGPRQFLGRFDVPFAGDDRIPGFDPGTVPIPEGKTR